MVEELFSLKYGVGGLCVLLTIFILMKLLDQKENLSTKAFNELKESVDALKGVMEKSTIQSELLKLRVENMSEQLSHFPKFQTDVRRFYTAIKSLAGDRWPQIREEMLKDEFTL